MENEKRSACLAWLDAEGVAYTLEEHPPAWTMADVRAFGLDKRGNMCKNLFLRDSNRGKFHYLLVVCGDKAVDLKALGKRVGKRLSFASDERLERFLHLKPGEVTPLGVLFDEEAAVELLLDEDIAAAPGPLGFHPCDNTATVWLSYADLQRLLQSRGNARRLLQLDEVEEHA